MGFFLSQVLSYMYEYSWEILSKIGQVRIIIMALEGAVAHWMVTYTMLTLPEFQNFNQFMAVLRWRFEDPLADWKARDFIKTVRQD